MEITYLMLLGLFVVTASAETTGDSMTVFRNDGTLYTGVIIGKTLKTVVLQQGDTRTALLKKTILIKKQPLESRDHFLIRAGGKFADIGMVNKALEILLSVKTSPETSDTLKYLLSQTFIKADQFDLALAGNLGIQDSSLPYYPAVEYQRFRLYKMLNFKEQAHRTAHHLADRYPRSPYADTVKSYLGIHRSRWLPGVTAKSSFEYVFLKSQTLRSGMDPLANPAISAVDTLRGGTYGSIQPQLSWKLGSIGPMQFTFEPEATINFPLRESNTCYLSLSAQFYATHLVQRFGIFRYGAGFDRQFLNSLPARNSAALYGVFIRPLEKGRSIIVLVNGSVQRSENSYLNSAFAGVTIWTQSVMKIGKWFSSDILCSGMSMTASAIKDYPRVVYSSGITAGSRLRDGHFYYDSTYTHEWQPDFYSFKGPSFASCRQVQTTIPASVIPRSAFSLTPGIGIHFYLGNAVEVKMKSGYQLRAFPEKCHYSNLKRSSADLFYNRDDAAYYYSSNPDLENGTFERFEPSGAYRFDKTLQGETAIAITTSRFGAWELGVSLERNRSNIETGSLNFSSLQWAPTVLWTNKF